MSDIRFNRWLHNSGTGGVYQDYAGNVGVGTSVPRASIDIAVGAASSIRVGSAVTISHSGGFQVGSSTLHSSGLNVASINSTGVTTVTRLNVGTGASISSPATNVLALGTNDLERIRIDSNGFLIMPAGSFDLCVGDSNNSNAGSQTISVGSTSSGSSGGIQIWANPTNGNSFIQFGDNSASASQYRGWINYQHADDNLNFGTAGTEALRINSSGNIGINSTNPSSSKLHVEGSIFARKGSSSILFNEYNNGSILWMDGSDGDMSGGDYWGIYAQSASQWGVNYAGGTNILNITASDSLVFTSNSLCVATSTIKQKLTVNGDIGIYKGGGQTRIFTVKGGSGTFSTLTITVNQYDYGSFVYDLKVHGYSGRYLHYAGGAYENGAVFGHVTTISQKSASATFTGPTWISGHTWRITVTYTNAWIHPVGEFSVSGGGKFTSSESDISMVWS